MIFLTYNDNYSGIYQSQVLDVCGFVSRNSGIRVKLVALISLRNFLVQRKLIRLNYRNAIILPMFPKTRFWKMNTFLLFFICLFSGERKIWARGPFACNMAISLKRAGLLKKVLFDARGAYKAELTEYIVVEDVTVVKNIALLEKRALMGSDVQLAVSAELKKWWREAYQFEPRQCEIIPCTLNEQFNFGLPTEREVGKLRESLGFSGSDIVLVYSGSSAGWQSFQLVDDYLTGIFEGNEKARLIFLSNEIPKNSNVFKKYKERILVKWVKPGEVRDIMLAGDYGLLIREKSVTNQVASPVKFAEYLACGLQVIISEGIGDFTEFVKKNRCGSIGAEKGELAKTDYDQKKMLWRLSIENFAKGSQKNTAGYKRLIDGFISPDEVVNKTVPWKENPGEPGL